MEGIDRVQRRIADAHPEKRAGNPLQVPGKILAHRRGFKGCEGQTQLFGGGAGGGVSITPIAFLVIQNGNVKVLQVQSFSSTADRVVGMMPEVIDRVSGFVSGLGKKDGEPEAPAPQPGQEV